MYSEPIVHYKKDCDLHLLIFAIHPLNLRTHRPLQEGLRLARAKMRFGRGTHSRVFAFMLQSLDSVMPRFKNKYRIQTTRLPGWDYASAGWYFVTICTRDRQSFFGHIADGIMHLSTLGQIASRFGEEIPQHTAAHVSLDAFVVMPDHIHGIIAIHHPTPHGHGVDGDGDGDDGGGGRDVACNVSTCNVSTNIVHNIHPSLRNPLPEDNPMSAISPKAGSLGAIIRSYKAAVTRWARHHGHHDFAWQARFYDRIIRDDDALHSIRQYIRENPQRWKPNDAGV